MIMSLGSQLWKSEMVRKGFNDQNGGLVATRNLRVTWHSFLVNLFLVHKKRSKILCLPMLLHPKCQTDMHQRSDCSHDLPVVNRVPVMPAQHQQYCLPLFLPIDSPWEMIFLSSTWFVSCSRGSQNFFHLIFLTKTFPFLYFIVRIHWFILSTITFYAS